MSSFECWSLTLSVATLIALAIYTLLTFIISRSSIREVEYQTRPAVSFGLTKESEEAHIWFEARNFSHTDAVGYVSVEFSYNGGRFELEDDAYNGTAKWNFPAREGVIGHKEFSGLLKGREIIGKPVNLTMRVSIKYKKWDSKRATEVTSDEFYHALPKCYEWRTDKWVPVLAS